VPRSWNGAVRRIFQGDLSSSRLALPTLLLWEGGGRDALGDPFMQADPGDLLMQTGRTLLVVPETSNWLDLRNVLIAWNDTPEARRAVADALPMLRKAENVIVAETVEDVYGRPGALSGAKDLVGWLSRHGVLASEQVPDDCGHAAAQLGRIASEVGASLVVAGGLRSLAASRMGFRGSNEGTHQSVEALFAAVAVKPSGIDLDQNDFRGSVVQ
jgi:hypothetical protein